MVKLWIKWIKWIYGHFTGQGVLKGETHRNGRMTKGIIVYLHINSWSGRYKRTLMTKIERLLIRNWQNFQGDWMGTLSRRSRSSWHNGFSCRVFNNFRTLQKKPKDLTKGSPWMLKWTELKKTRKRGLKHKSENKEMNWFKPRPILNRHRLHHKGYLPLLLTLRPKQ